MSDPSYPAAAAARPRPSSVTISSYLLILYAVLQVIGLILSLSTFGATQDAYRDLYAGTSAEGSETIAAAGSIGGAIVGLLLAVGFVVLALLNNRGKNVSRIVTWVICGIAICCAGLGLAGTALTESIGTGSTGDMPSTAEVQQRLDEALPSWYTPVTLTLSVIGMIALIGAVILLALPASNAFFRKPPAGGWEPPLPGAAYPAYPPAYPNAVGYPSTTPPGYPPAPPVQSDNPYAPPAPTGDPGAPSAPPSHHGPSSHHGTLSHPGAPSDPGPSSASPSDPGPSSAPSSDPGSSATPPSDSGSSSTS